MAKKNNDEEKWALRPPNEILEGLTMGKVGQTRYRLIPTEHLNDATRAGLIDMTLGRIDKATGLRKGAPIVRFDNPHAGKGVSSLPHINIDPKGFPNANNPHIAVPASLIACADKMDKCLKTVGKGLFIVAVVTDGVRICAAIYGDMNSDEKHVLPQKTITEIASIAGGWSGGAAGATGGAILGTTIGAGIGSLFGGVGALIGAPIGSVVGSFTGGVVGGLLGEYVARRGAKAVLNN